MTRIGAKPPLFYQENNMEDDRDNHIEYLKEALAAYGITEEYVLAWRHYPLTDSTVIITVGGKKITHKYGEAAKCKLSFVEITGCLPEGNTGGCKRIDQGQAIVKVKCKWRRLWEKIKKNVKNF